MDHVVLFVCTHGAGKSRMAAAFFNAAAPAGWRATTAGVEPQAEVSVHAPRLLAGLGAEAELDHERPRPIGAVPGPARMVAIDCALSGAEVWSLEHSDFDELMRDEIRARAEALAREVTR